MTTYLRERPVTVKAVDTNAPGLDIELAEGEFVALVSVFNNIDSYGDVVLPGAFTKSIQEWEDAGDPIPVVWSHKWDDPFSHIGHVIKAWETDEGLMIHAALDLENPTAVQVHKLLKARRVREFSFAFDVRDAGWGIRKRDDGSERDVYELRELDITEVGPCLKGVNRQTDLRDVKGTPPPRESKTTPERKGESGAAFPHTTAVMASAWLLTTEK